MITHPTWLHCLWVCILKEARLIWSARPCLVANVLYIPVTDGVSDTQGFCLLGWQALLNTQRLLKLHHTSSCVFRKHSKEKEKKTPKGQRSFHHMFLSIEFLGSLTKSAASPAESKLLQSPLDKGILYHLPLIISKMQSLFDQKNMAYSKSVCLCHSVCLWLQRFQTRKRKILSPTPVFFLSSEVFKNMSTVHQVLQNSSLSSSVLSEEHAHILLHCNCVKAARVWPWIPGSWLWRPLMPEIHW